MLSLILLRLTLEEVLADLPHDAGALVVYALLAVSIGFIWYGSRGKKPDSSASRPERTEKR